MRKTFALIILAVSLVTATASAQQMPPGRWWRRPEITRTLGLTADQQSRLDAIFRGAANELIDRRADVEKAMIALRGELDQPQLNRANIERLAQRVGEARSKQFEREVIMLVEMRGALNDDQWQSLRAHLDRPRMQEKKQRPPDRP
jgi:hypothetical protein